MDNEAFDRLTRLLSGAGTRRATLGAVLATALLGRESGGAKNRRQRRRVRTQAQSPCQNPGPGKNLSGCDYSGADLRGRSFRGANLSRAKLIGAELCSADLRGANLHKTDFTGAHLTRTDLRGTNLSSAILTDAHFCQTRMPKGTLNTLFSSASTSLSQTLVFSWAGSTAPSNGGVIGFDFDVSAVPLPAGGMLLLTALGGLVLMRRRQTV